jgi:hypothetical protein
LKLVRRFGLFTLAMLAMVAPAQFAAQSQEKVDLDMVGRIRYEGFRNSHIMELATGLMDGVGPRLTGSPNMKKANEWTRDKLTEFGLVNAHIEPWTPFGRGWWNEYVNARMTAPDIATLIAYSNAWTPGTEGPVKGKVVRVNITQQTFERDKQRYAGKLAGAVILFGDDPELKPVAEPLFERYNDKNLSDIANYSIPSERPPFRPQDAQRRQKFARDLNDFLATEKVACIVQHSRGAIGGGTVFVQAGGPYRTGQTSKVPSITVATEQWDRMNRLLKAKQDVEMEVNINNHFSEDSETQWNTLAEIPGTDKKDELVMLGAHLDSWHAGTGATDNGAGTIVMMEAVRILKAIGVKPRRTIRIGLWSGEEEGLLGSQHYVEQHFGSRPPLKDPDAQGAPTLTRRDAGPMTVKPEQAKVSVYFNVDNGTGKIRGVYMQENAQVQPIFESWMKPFQDLGMDTLTMRNTGGTDHLSFDAAGIPGFQFIQDPMDYDTRTHHSNMDVVDRLQSDDLRQMAVIVADFVYNAAMRDQMFPRKQIEKELPPAANQGDDDQGVPPPRPPARPSR